MNEINVSFIIPARNEQNLIGKVIESIICNFPSMFCYEIILVDNLSSDKTMEIAQSYNVTVISSNANTVASLRNHGARIATGNIFIFIDADVLIKKKWGENIYQVLRNVYTNPLLLTGSWYGLSDSPSWLERSWFGPLTQGSKTHINSGHLIISKYLFQKLNGFDPDLITGEDYDFSQRAIALGATIDDNAGLEVSHEGYPKNIKDFIKREVWHGKGDFQRFGFFIKSKVALLSVSLIFLHLLILINMFLKNYIVVSICIFMILFLCMSSSLVKYTAAGFKTVFVNTFLYYVYFWARFFSFIGRK